MPPGAYFRQLKANEARRLIEEEGWRVKAAAYHLGYRHANELSRALAGHSAVEENLRQEER
jgi:AraC-like DNA-binding protein